MATDTARIKLELASGRNEVTAPFHQTAQRRRSQPEEPLVDAAPPDLPPNAQVMVDVPLGSIEPPSVSRSDPVTSERPRLGRPTWIAFLGAIIAVATAGWWVMFQRLPDKNPPELVQRHLVDARIAMAEGRYTDPPEHSALHYYTAVLALDPDNADAIAGIDAIADRHVTDARVLLAEQRVAEAGVAIEKARRIRPNHSSLLALDMQLRIELRKILAAANAALQAEPVKAKVAKVTNASPPRAEVANRTSAPGIPSPRPLLAQPEDGVPNTATVPPESGITSTPSVDHRLLAFAQSQVEQTSTPLITPAASEPAAPVTGAPGSAPVVDEPANASAAPDATVRTVAPKLIKMVQPQYPQEALMRGIEGWVDVSLEVNAAGDVVAPRIEDSSRGRLFNRAALSAVQQWKYEPRTDGEASERVRVRLQFRQSK